jgi:hypothetical protein
LSIDGDFIRAVSHDRPMSYRIPAENETVPLLDRLGEHLEIGETILWYGLPIPELHARMERGTVFFSVIWNLFLVFWTGGVLWGAVSSGEPIAYGMAVFSIPFWIVGFFLATAPKRARSRAKNTLYAITEKRAVIFVDDGTSSVQSFYLDKLSELEKTVHSDGTGDLRLAVENRSDGDGGTRKTPIGFMGIPDVKNVDEILRRARDASSE